MPNRVLQPDTYFRTSRSTLRVESRVGYGSTFSLFLPRQYSGRASTSSRERPSAPPPKRHDGVLPPDLLGILNEGSQVPASPPERWAFLDTETTGLMGNAGVYAFLIGVGRISRGGFSVRQFFMREYTEEKSMLKALSAHLENGVLTIKVAQLPKAKPRKITIGVSRAPDGGGP